MPTTASSLTRPIAALAVACALAVSGCGGDDEPTASTSTGAGASTTAAGGATTGSNAGGGSSTGGGSTASGGSSAGGSSSAGSGDEATYVRTLEGVCKKVAEESQTFVSDVSKAGADGNSAEAFAKVKGPMTRFFDAIDARYQELAQAEAPAKWADYQASLRSDAAGVSKYLDEAKDLLNDADSPEDLSKLQELMGRTTFNTGDAPKDLAAKTPSCQPSGAASSGRPGVATVTTPAP